MIDWVRVFEHYGVDHVIGPAPNVRRGRVGLSCPQCGSDTKNHFSVDIETGRVIGCWRDRTHWMPPAVLLATVAGISQAKARELCKDTPDLPVSETPGAMLASLERAPAKAAEEEAVEWDSSLKRFTGHAAERRFLRYLGQRGFDDPAAVARQFGLRYATVGRWNARVAVPIWRMGPEGGTFCGWSARAITAASAKYLAHPIGSAMQRLLWESWAVEKGDTLVVVEGPFDGLKLAAYAPRGFTIVSLLTNVAGRAKIARLLELASRAARTVIVLDRGAEGQGLDLQAQLMMARPAFASVPESYKDPGDIPAGEVRRFLKLL